MRAAPVLPFVLVLASVAGFAQCGNDTFGTAGGGGDAGADGSVTSPDAGDEGARPDAAFDAGDAATADGGPCVGATHWVCDNFDRDGGLAMAPFWDTENLTDAGVLSIVTPGKPDPPSLPNALLSSAHGGEIAYVAKTDIGSSNGVRCDFSFRIDERAPFQVNLVILNLYASGGYYYRLGLNGGAAGGQDAFGEEGKSPDGVLAPAILAGRLFPEGVWNRVSLEATFGGGAHIRIAVNGVDQGISSTFNLASFPAGTSMTVQVGASALAGTGRWTGLYDDVFCDLLP